MGPTAATAAEPGTVSGSSAGSRTALTVESRFPSAIHLPLPTGFTVTIESIPGLSINQLILDAVDSAPGLISPWLRARVLEALGPQGRAAYYPMVADTPTRTLPAFVVPTVGVGEGWMKEARDQIADVRLSELDVEFSPGQLLDPEARQWRDIVRNPRPWLEQTATAFHRVATALEPVRRAHAARIRVEEQRFHLMAEAGTVPQFLASVSSVTELVDHAVRFEWDEEVTMPMQSSRVVLAPLYSTPESFVIHATGGFARGPDSEELVLGYPVTGLHPWLDPATRSPGPAPADRIELLLGAARAVVFRAADPPTTMGALARVLDMAPSTASHHVGKLVESGLMTRFQVGKEVWVLRTAAGDQLLNLLD